MHVKVLNWGTVTDEQGLFLVLFLEGGGIARMEFDTMEKLEELTIGLVSSFQFFKKRSFPWK